MATDDSETTGNDEYFDKICSPCSKNGKHKEASKFCDECGTFLCIQCVSDHCKFPSLQFHQLLDDAALSSQNRITELCDIHHGRIVDKYCKDHDEVCCGACVSGKHRLCENHVKIDEIELNIDSKEQEEANERINTVIENIKIEQRERGLLLSAINSEKSSILKDIDVHEQRIIKRIKKLADASRDEVVSKHDKFVKDITACDKELESVQAVTEKVVKKLNMSDISAEQAFINIRKSNTMAKSVTDTLHELSKSENISLDYCFDDEQIKMLVDKKSLGYFEETENKPYFARKQGMINVKLEKEEDCVITGICFLENGIIVIADAKNKKLKMLNDNYEIKNDIILAGNPYSLCYVGKQEVAVALRNEEKVQFVSCGDAFSLEFSFTTSKRCAGLYFDTKRDELFVSCDSWGAFKSSKVCVYTKSGVLTRIYKKDEAGKNLFTYPKNVTMDPFSDTVYIADEKNGVIALCSNGKLKWKYQDKKIRDLSGICMLPGNQLLVTGCSSKNLVQVGGNGTEVGELLGASEGLTSPYTVVCDRRNSKIIVGCASNEIHIYEIQKKKYND